MRAPARWLILAGLSCAACAPSQLGRRDPGLDPLGPAPGEHMVQGLVGATDFTDLALEASSPAVAIEDAGTSTLPMLGAAVMLPLAGEGVQLGVETGVTAGWDVDRGRLRLNNTTIVDSNNDVVLADLFVGAYANAYLSERWRLYGGAGPLLQFGHVVVTSADPTSPPIVLHEDGFGLGVYTRAGLELLLWDGTWAGIGVRWVDSRVDLGGAFSDFDFEALQYAFTATYRY